MNPVTELHNERARFADTAHAAFLAYGCQIAVLTEATLRTAPYVTGQISKIITELSEKLRSEAGDAALAVAHGLIGRRLDENTMRETIRTATAEMVRYTTTTITATLRNAPPAQEAMRALGRRISECRDDVTAAIMLAYTKWEKSL